MIKKAALTLGALALAIGGAALVAPAAQANSTVSVPGARAYFTSDGEIFRLYDTKCDNETVYLQYRVNGGPVDREDFPGGCSSTRHATYNKDFSEGAEVRYRVCTNPSHAADRCSVWRTDRA